MDLVLVAASAAFYAVSWLYAVGCDALIAPHPSRAAGGRP